jgi:hypothetical protein
MVTGTDGDGQPALSDCGGQILNERKFTSGLPTLVFLASYPSASMFPTIHFYLSPYK